MDWSWLGLYALFESAAGIVIIVLFFIIRRRKEALLKQDTAPMYIDDDYYWRNGWYSNPDDRRLFIQDRVQQYELYREFRQDGRKSHNRHYLWAADRHDGGKYPRPADIAGLFFIPCAVIKWSR